MQKCKWHNLKVLQIIGVTSIYVTDAHGGAWNIFKNYLIKMQ